MDSDLEVIHRCEREFRTARGDAYTAIFRIVIAEREDSPGGVVRKEREKQDAHGWETIEAYIVTNARVERDVRAGVAT